MRATLHEILGALSGARLQGPAGCEAVAFDGVSTDSRTVAPGSR